MTTFTEFVSSRRITDTPRGDFIEDTRSLISIGQFSEPEGLGDLIFFLRSRQACQEAVRQGRKVWHQYARAAAQKPTSRKANNPQHPQCP
jgi:hypothetical protein